jgi:hypothetical protein
VFGLWEAAVDATLRRRLTYLESTDCFYTNHTDGNLAANFQPVGIQVYPNCTRVYYVYNDDTKGVVTLYKYGAAWRIHSNHVLGTEPAINTVFPEGLDSSDATLEKFQTMFSFGSWNSQALCCSYSDPRDLELYNFFYGLEFEDEPPLTREERDAIVAMSGYEDYSWLDGARFPVEKMDAKLQEMFGVSLDEMHKDAFSLMYYLESTNSYYYFNGGFSCVDFLRIIGARTMENGYVQVYYGVGFGYHLDYLDQGVVTLKPVGDGYQVVSNYYFEDGTWPELQPAEPTEPEAGDNSAPMYFPEDMLTDADTVGKFQELLSCKHPEDNFFNMALLSVYTDPRKVDLEDLFYNGFYGQNDNPDSQEEADALKAHGWNVDEYDISRCPADEMNRVLTQLFGLALADYTEEDLEAFVYLELTDCYYLCHSDSNCAHVLQVAGYRVMENGDIEVFYMWDYWTDMNGVITLKPNGESYLILSNIFARAPK